MRLRLLLLFLLILLGGLVPSMAQDRKPLGEFNAGYSMITDFDYTGHGFNVGMIGNPSNWFGLEGQADAWYNVAKTKVDMYVVAGGPRFAMRTRTATPFVHFLVGGAFARHAGVTNSEFVMKLGGGVDFNFGRNYAWRLELNDLMFVDPMDHNLNASTSFVYRWR
jgi:hypothetical protein